MIRGEYILDRRVYWLLSILLIIMVSSSTASPIGLAYNYKGYSGTWSNGVEEASGNVPFYISFILHFHQPIYDVSRNICQVVSNTNSDVYRTFDDREKIYTYKVLNLIDYINDNNLPVNISIDITGTLIENLKNLTTCASSIPGYGNYTDVDTRWSSRSYQHVEFLYTYYHYDLLPMTTRFNNGFAEDLLIHDTWLHREILHNFTNTYPGFEGVKGFYPPEIAVDNDSLELLARLGYNYTIIDDLHLYRIFRDYLNPMRSPEQWYMDNPINTATDPLYLLNTSLENWSYMELTVGGVNYQEIMNPYIGLRPHAVSTSGGDIVVFPRNRLLSVLMHAIMYITNDDIDQALNIFFSKINYLQQYNNDSRRPFILVMAFDGDNGDPLTHMDTWWEFLRRIIENVTTPGSRYSYVKIVSPGWYLKHVYNPINDNDWRLSHIPFIEPGSWNTDTTWGDPYFIKWIYPSKYSNEQKMLSNITKAIAYYLNAKTYNPSDPRLNKSLEYLALALQSDWFYFPTNQWLMNSSLAALESIWVSSNITTSDYSGPGLMIAWFENPDNNYWPGIIYSDTHPWIKIHSWDVSDITSIRLDVTAGSSTYTYWFSPDPDLNGNYYAQITGDLPVGGIVELTITATDQNGYTSTITYKLGRVADSKHRLDGVVNTDSKPIWINRTNNMLQYLFLNDTSDLVYLGFNTTLRGSGYDTFLFMSTEPSKGVIPHPWVKAGNVPYYDGYLGMEEANGWYGLWWKLSGEHGVKDVLITNSTLLMYRWASGRGFAEVYMSKELFDTDRVFIGLAAWGTSDGSGVYEKLKWLVSDNNLYSDELVGVYIGEPYIKPFFTPDDGGRALETMLSEIIGAKAYIYLAIYNFNNDTPGSLVWRIAEGLVNASNNGVRVKVVVDDSNIGKDPIQYLISNGVEVVDDNNADYLMHVKLLIIDGVSVFYGSANLVDEAYYESGGDYQYNDVVMVHSTWFSKPLEYEFIEMFYKHIFHGGDDPPSSLMYQRIYLNDTWVNVEFYNLPDDSVIVENRLLDLISGSEKVYLLQYLITRNSIGDALVDRCRSGGDVKILLSYSKRLVIGSEYIKLLSNHVPTAINLDDKLLGGYQLLHHKVFIFNNTILASGSMNPSTRGLEYNDELLIIIHYKKLAMEYTVRFNTLWKRFTANITVRVMDGDKPATNAYVNITITNLGALTSNSIEWYNYTGYTDTNGYFNTVAYLWNPDPTAYFYVNASINERYNITTIILGLDNNTATTTIWITKYITPILSVTGPQTVNATKPATYQIKLLYPNGTTVRINRAITISINSTIEIVNLVDGEASWTHVFITPGTYILNFSYSGGDWIYGLKLEPASIQLIVEVNYISQIVNLSVTGPTSIYYGETASYTIKLVNTTDNTLIQIDTTVNIYINGTLIDSIQLVNGEAVWSYKPSTTGLFNILFEYPGGDIVDVYNLSSSSATLGLMVYKAPLSVSVSAPSSVYVGEEFNITLTVYNAITGEPVPNANIDIYLNSTYYTTVTTNASGVAVLTLSIDKPGALTIYGVASADPTLYTGTGMVEVVVINVIGFTTTTLYVDAPSTMYLYEPATIKIEVRDQSGKTIPINGFVLIYINGSMNANLTLVNGVVEYTYKPTQSDLGVLNITIIFPQQTISGIIYRESTATIYINVARRPIKITTSIDWEWINDTYIHISGTVNIYDKLNNTGIDRGYILVYLDKYGNGTYRLVANESVVNGRAYINITMDPDAQPRLRIVYNDPAGVYVSGGEPGSAITLTLTQRMIPAPETPYIIPLILLSILVLIEVYRRRGES